MGFGHLPRRLSAIAVPALAFEVRISIGCWVPDDQVRCNEMNVPAEDRGDKRQDGRMIQQLQEDGVVRQAVALLPVLPRGETVTLHPPRREAVGRGDQAADQVLVERLTEGEESVAVELAFCAA